MESLSNIREKVRLPLCIKVHPYLMDHRFQDKAVLPAVEAMEILAESTLAHLPEKSIHCIVDARFDKFLILEKGILEIEAFNDLEVLDSGEVVSRLITRTHSKKTMITRTREHAVLCFRDDPKTPDPLPLKFPETPDCHVSFETIYNTLVPFGPSYHNLKGEVSLSEKGAEAEVHAPPLRGLPIPLGSPFPMDAAFHAACVWGQRYVGCVGFPVGFQIRRVLKATRPGITYRATIIAKETYSDRFLVDVRLSGPNRILYEEVQGLIMRDVTRGRMMPPRWFSKIGLS